MLKELDYKQHSPDYQKEILTQAGKFIRSPQGSSERPFLRPSDTRDLEDIERTFRDILSSATVCQLGIMIGGEPLDQVYSRYTPPMVSTIEEADCAGFWTGVKEAFEEMGIGPNQTQFQLNDVGALRALAAAVGWPTEEQITRPLPEKFIGAKMTNSYAFDEGVTNGIKRKGEKPNYLNNVDEQFRPYATKGYKDGVLTAFLHFIALQQLTSQR